MNLAVVSHLAVFGTSRDGACDISEQLRTAEIRFRNGGIASVSAASVSITILLLLSCAFIHLCSCDTVA